MVHISASPPTALVDEDIDIQVSGLQPNQSITLSSMLKEKMVKYLAYAHFMADENGNVSTKWSRSVGGTYEGQFICYSYCNTSTIDPRFKMLCTVSFEQ